MSVIKTGVRLIIESQCSEVPTVMEFDELHIEQVGPLVREYGSDGQVNRVYPSSIATTVLTGKKVG